MNLDAIAGRVYARAMRRHSTSARPARPVNQPAEQPPELPHVLSFLRHLWAVHHALQAASKRMQRRYQVTGLQRLTVRIVGRSPGISAGALADVLHVHPSTLTGVLRRLVARGLLERVSDARDRRKALFALTPAGRRIDASKRGTVEAAVARALASLPAESIAAAREVLESIERSLG